MTGISTNAKQGELNGFCDCVGHFANAVCGIVENSSQVRLTTDLPSFVSLKFIFLYFVICLQVFDKKSIPLQSLNYQGSSYQVVSKIGNLYSVV